MRGRVLLDAAQGRDSFLPLWGGLHVPPRLNTLPLFQSKQEILTHWPMCQCVTLTHRVCMWKHIQNVYGNTYTFWRIASEKAKLNFFYSWLSWFLVFHYNKELTHWGEMETDVVIRSWCSKHSHPLLPYQSNQTLSLLRASFNLYFLFIAAMCSFWWHHAMVSLVDSLWASNGKMLKLLFFFATL